MNCPNCQNELIESDIWACNALTCKNCSGVWVPGIEMRGMLRKNNLPSTIKGLLETNDNPVNESQRKCAYCSDTKLQALLVRNVEIDVCIICNGVFFDKNEFEEVLVKHRSHSSTKVATEVGKTVGGELVFSSFIGLLKSVF